jgi:hypothetical protein
MFAVFLSVHNIKILKHDCVYLKITNISNTNTTLSVLQNALVEMICEQPSWGRKMPKPWIHLEMVINKKVENGSKVIPFKMYLKITNITNKNTTLLQLFRNVI